MSRVRGFFPILFATALGIGNGIYIFGPAFKDEQQAKESAARKIFESQHRDPEHSAELEAVKQAEDRALGAGRTPTASVSEASGTTTSRSWLPSLWARDADENAIGEQREAVGKGAAGERRA